MYRVALESLLGLSVADGTELRIAPCVPDEWPAFAATWRLPGGETRYRVRATRAPAGRPLAATLDGAPLSCAGGVVRAPLRRDGALHEVEIVLGPCPAAAAHGP
jgi:cyclic beta-1,2-glucan synthetase